MDVLQIAKRSASTIYRNKHWWLFGFFVAASGGGAAGSSGVGGGGGGAAAAVSLPAWVAFAIAGAVVLGLAGLVMHIVSEGALIEAVRRGEDGQASSLRLGFRAGRRHFWPMLRVKLLTLVGAFFTVAATVGPAVLGVLGVWPMLAGAIASGAMALVAVPVLLSLYFSYEYAMRFVVLEGRDALDALAQGRRLLFDHLDDALLLFLADGAGRGLGIAGVLIAIAPLASLAAGIGYLAGALVGAVIGGAIVAVPLAIVAVGAIGSYRSSVWTLGFMGVRS